MTYPSMALLFAPLLTFVGIAVLRPDVTPPGWVGATLVLGALASSWLWWALALPRWRVWAIANVDDLGSLVLRATAASLTWLPGHILERAEIRPAALQHELAGVLREALARYRRTDPAGEPALRALLEPWLHPGRRRVPAWRGPSPWPMLASIFGLFCLTVAIREAVAHALYDTSFSPSGSAGVTAVGVTLVVYGERNARMGAAFSSCVFLGLLGLSLSATVLRSYPWSAAELLVLGVGLACFGGFYLGSRAMRRKP